jgi:hypothetical protein
MTTTTETTSETPPSIDLEAWRLLPWLANDTLEAEEMDRLLDHLKRSPRCRRELLFLSELRYAVEMSRQDSLEVPEARLGALMERIDAHESDARNAPPGSIRSGRFGGGPAAVRFLAQAALVVLSVGLLWWLLTGGPASDVDTSLRRAPQFQTLSSGDSPSVGQIPRLRLVPEDGLEEEDLRRLVLDLGAEIVAGPTAAGAYTLGWTTQKPPDSLDDVASALRADPRIALAEPVRGP